MFFIFAFYEILWTRQSVTMFHESKIFRTFQEKYLKEGFDTQIEYIH